MLSLSPEQIRVLVDHEIRQGGLVAGPELRARISAYAGPSGAMSPDDVERMAREFEERLGITMEEGSVLDEGHHVPWLAARRTRDEFYYWDRYRIYMQDRVPPNVISPLDHVTDRILDLCGDPATEGVWDRRGMVVGHVQSGKTANYLGLVCKAADVGYRVIVIIAGIHNNLRSQTQQRVDEGFVGRSSDQLAGARSGRAATLKGAGRISGTRIPVTFTNTLRDFNKATAGEVGVSIDNLNEPAVFVIKKNPKTLRSLVDWLKGRNTAMKGHRVKAPLLLIDDEADNASINVASRDGDVSTINGLIRELLQLFERSSYVGYTATPFANIFVDPDASDPERGEDLFPRDFIVSLDPPTNYFGPEVVFGGDAASVVRFISDHDDSLPIGHRIDHSVGDLPESLHEAVRTFMLARAIRVVRGHRAAHSSMLVNVSRFTGVQARVRNVLHEIVERYRRSLRVNGKRPPGEAERDTNILALRETFAREYAEVEGVEWASVLSALLDAVGPIEVVEINSRASGSLAYDLHPDGRHVIAVGGFSLSRGLTLEGLIVSYFLRNSMMYDTLMQMGRWFGYRDGYRDICRIWMTEDAEGWYSHITEAVRELRYQFRKMEQAHAPPRDFGLKVRQHPESLMITARNKMRSSELVWGDISLSERLIETWAVAAAGSAMERNREAARQLVAELNAFTGGIERWSRIGGGYLVSRVPFDKVTGFFEAFDNHPLSHLTDTEAVIEFTRRAATTAGIREWDVYFVGKKGAQGTEPWGGLGVPLVCQEREAVCNIAGGRLELSRKQRLSSRGIERVGLEPAEIALAEREYDAARKRDGVPPTQNFPDIAYRRFRKRPLLMVHAVRVVPHKDNVGSLPQEPIVGWGVSFPPLVGQDITVRYAVNTVYLREIGRGDDTDEEMEGIDD